MKPKFVVATAFISHGVPTEFQEKVHDAIKQMQEYDIEVEVQYEMAHGWDPVRNKDGFLFTALIIGRKEGKE